MNKYEVLFGERKTKISGRLLSTPAYLWAYGPFVPGPYPRRQNAPREFYGLSFSNLGLLEVFESGTPSQEGIGHRIPYAELGIDPRVVTKLKFVSNKQMGWAPFYLRIECRTPWVKVS